MRLVWYILAKSTNNQDRIGPEYISGYPIYVIYLEIDNIDSRSLGVQEVR